MSRVLTAAAVLAMSFSAAESGVVTGKCDSDKCDAFEVLERSQVKRDAVHGEELILARIRSWVQDGEKRTGETEEIGHVFCSIRRPAMLVQDNGKTLVKFLAPLAKTDVENNVNLYASYYEVCHSKGGETAKRLDDLAKELNYTVTRAASTELKEANKPESVFWWTTPDVKVARPVFSNEPTKAAQLTTPNTDQPNTTESLKVPTRASEGQSSRSVASLDPHWRERLARAKAAAESRRAAAVRARERYAVAAAQNRYRRTSRPSEALAYAEPEQRAVYVPVRREAQGFFESLFGVQD